MTERGKRMKVTVCIGSSCHLKGSRQVIETFRRLVSGNGLEGSVELTAAFCLGRCQQGVCVMVGENVYSVSPDTAEDFFYAYIKTE